MSQVIFEICDWNEFDPLNGKHSPKGFMQNPITIDEFDLKHNYQRNMIVIPFLQSYRYLVIGFDPIYNYVKIIPHCNFAKQVFKNQYLKPQKDEKGKTNC